MIMQQRAGSRIGRGVLLATCLSVGAYAPANAETRAEVRVSAGIGVENNPFLLEDGTDAGASVAAELDVAPRVTISNERTSFSFSGNARLRQFFENYDTTGDLLLGAQGTTRLLHSNESGRRGEKVVGSSHGNLFLYGQDLAPFQLITGGCRRFVEPVSPRLCIKTILCG